METIPVYPLATATKACLTSFNTIIAALKVSVGEHKKLMSPTTVQNQRDRLKIWAGNLGALQQGSASLDFRLMESSLMQMTVLKLLEQLENTITRSNEVVRGLRPPLEEAVKDGIEQMSEDSSDDNRSDDENHGNKITELGQNTSKIEGRTELRQDSSRINRRTELGQNTSEIINILSDLFKLSFKIRNPATRSSAPLVLKSQLHKEMVQVEYGASIDLLASYSNFDCGHVEESFREMRRLLQRTEEGARQRLQASPVLIKPVNAGPRNNDASNSEVGERELNSYLIERWSKSITNRRRHFAYWRKHARKLAKEDFEEVEGEQPAPKNPSVQQAGEGHIHASEQVKVLDKPAVTLSAAGKSILSGTEVTRYDRKLDDNIDAQSTISYASTAYDIDGGVMDLPSPPSVGHGQSEFTCLYCCVTYPVRQANGKHWREHILQDLLPYMCTYPDCPEADAMYASRASWLGHEAQVHRKVWRCFEHTGIFKSKEALSQHLETRHENLGKAQVQGIVDLSHASIKDNRTMCPFCLSEGPFQKDLANHMAFHMEKLACFALPRGTGAEDDKSSHGNSSNNARGVRSVDSLMSVSLNYSAAGSHAASPESLPSDTSSANFVINDGEDLLRERPHNREHQKILDWLTPADYSSQQSDFLRQRQAGTCQWFLDSAEFSKWLGTYQQTLLCPGIPGAGKTILTATVIDDLHTRFRDDKSVGIAYLYCNYRRSDMQTADEILMSLLKQLAQSQPSLPDSVRSLHDNHKQRRTRPSFDEISSTLQSVAAMYSSVYILIDALDECRGMSFLSAILDVQAKCGANVFMTSRFIPKFTKQFKNTISLEIRATDADVKRYVDSNMSRLRQFARYRPEVQEEIKTRIIQSVKGMFLLAKIQIESLETKTTAKATLAELREFPSVHLVYDRVYEEAMQRIDGENAGLEKLAMQVLSWITRAKRLLTTSELQHALSVEVGQLKLDEDRICSVEHIVSACSGLVTVDKESGNIGLVHYTAHDYFNRTIGQWISNIEANLAAICVTYLSFDKFKSGFCQNTQEFEERLQSSPFYDYAARTWGHHAREASTLGPEIIRFLESKAHVEGSIQALFTIKSGSSYLADIQDFPKEMTGLHLAAYFGVEKAARLLLGGSSPDLKDSYGRTPLLWAAGNGHEPVVKLLLESIDVDVNSKDIDARTSLSLAAEQGCEPVVMLLLDKGAEVDAKDTGGWTPLSWAAEKGHEDVVMLLLGKGAGIDAKDAGGRTPLLLAAEQGYGAVVMLLLEKRAKVDAKDTGGRTPLSWAAEKGHKAAVMLLLGRGAEVDAKDTGGRTPLSWAAEKGHEDVVMLLLDNEAEVDSKDNLNLTPAVVGSETWARDGGEAAVVV